MKSKVYIETTIVSYLVASPTRDLIQSAHQEITRQWWTERRGDTRAAARRVAAAEKAATEALSTRRCPSRSQYLVRLATTPSTTNYAQ